MRRLVLALGAMCLCACDSSDDPEETGASSTTDAGSSSGLDPGPASDSGTPSDEPPPPTENEAVLAWLQAGSYTAWDSESSVHPSAGPHFGDVRTFFNPTLVNSFEDGNTEHPVDAASVKELYGDSSEIRGWAVMVKVEDDGGSWWWYEYFDDRVIAGGPAISLCESCHDDGVDLVLTPYPLP